MPESPAFGFGQYVPGFDFLQTLAESAAKGMPRAAPAGMPDWAGWIAPTLQPEELDKRIKELKTVQFWLEQNARALAATIQALEVQKMSLATLRGMNVQMGDLASAFRFPTADGASAAADPPAAPASAPRAAGAPGPYDDMFTAGAGNPAHRAAPQPEPAAAEQAAPPGSASASASAPQADAAPPADTPPAAAGTPGAAGVADPLQWWNALTEQFQQIAAAAIQDAARQPPVMAAAAPLADAARQAFDAATRMASGVAAAAGAGAAPAGAALKAPSAPARPPKATPRKAVARAPKAPSPRGAAAPAARSVARPPAPAASSAAPRTARRTPPPAAAPTAPRPTRKR